MRNLSILCLLFITFCHVAFAWGIQSSTNTESDWKDGFCQKISLTNTDNVALSWSEVHFTLKNATISSSWNGNFTSSNDTYTITPLSWNSSIAPSKTVDIGYCANGSGRPANLSLTSAAPSASTISRPLSVHLTEWGLALTASVTSDWNTGYCRAITLKNTLSSDMVNWKFSFDTPGSINFWSGKMNKSNNTFTITPETWNNRIAPQWQIDLGFCSNGEAVDSNWKILSYDTGTVVPPSPVPTPNPISPAPVNGVCWADNGKVLAGTPVNLCSVGTPSAVSGSGPWTWSCQGQNNGAMVSCKATKTAAITPLPSTGETLTYNVDASKNQSPISPYIYGRNFGDGNAENLASSRLGGNRLTGYNWENNASNAGSDWMQSSDGYLSSSDVPGKAVTDFHDKNQSLGIPYSLITLPMAGYVARDKNGSVSASETAPSNRWDDVIFSKKSAFSLVPDLKDHHVYDDEFVNFLVNKYGKANTSLGIKGYSLDNEPALWATTHPLLHPNKATVSEMITKSIDLSKAIKSVDGTAEVFGAVTYGYGENRNLQDASDWATYSSTYASYIDAFLAKLQSASTAYGARLLDVLDIHWYPEAQGVNASGGKTRIYGNNNDAGVAQARMQAPRSLWDPTYREDSWIGQWFQDSAFPLIPKLKASIEQYYPGTKLSISEFDYGGANHISWGIAMADVLGIYGKYGVYFASYWGDVNGYISSAYKLYRNVDGLKTTFGNTEIDATNPDIENTSIYASTEGVGWRAHIILLNKKNAPQKVHINLHAVTATSAEVYGFDAASADIRKMTPVNITANGIDYTLPALSAIHMILVWNTAPSSLASPSVALGMKTTMTSPLLAQNTVSLTQNSVNKPVVDRYLTLVENALDWKTKEKKIMVLRKVLGKLQGLANQSTDWKQKALLLELIDTTLAKIKGLY